MSLWRQRLIAAGLIRPWAKDLPPIQLPPGTVVLRVEPESCSKTVADAWDASAYAYEAIVYHSRPGSDVFVRQRAS